MNGFFTNAESQHLSSDERQHYLRLGLCAPLHGPDLERVIDCGINRVEELSTELDAVRDEYADTVRDLVESNHKIRTCLEFIREPKRLSVNDICDRVEEILT